jgi:hypothetical protein
MPGWVFIVLAIAASTQPTIYRCPGEAGEVLFSDRPCAGGHAQTTQPVNTVDMSHLSPDEQAMLDSLHESDKHRTSTAPVLRTNATSVTQDERRCDAARDGLERVRAMKRRGYRASSAATLDARERNYEVQRDRSCAHP